MLDSGYSEAVAVSLSGADKTLGGGVKKAFGWELGPGRLGQGAGSLRRRIIRQLAQIHLQILTKPLRIYTDVFMLDTPTPVLLLSVDRFVR